MYDEDIYVELKRLDHLFIMLRLGELGFDIYDKYFGTCMCGHCGDEDFIMEVFVTIFELSEYSLFSIEQTDLESLEIEGIQLDVPENMTPEWLYHICVEDIHATPDNEKSLKWESDYGLVSLKAKENDGKKFWDIWVDESLIYDADVITDVALFIRGCWHD